MRGRTQAVSPQQREYVSTGVSEDVNEGGKHGVGVHTRDIFRTTREDAQIIRAPLSCLARLTISEADNLELYCCRLLLVESREKLRVSVKV